MPSSYRDASLTPLSSSNLKTRHPLRPPHHHHQHPPRPASGWALEAHLTSRLLCRVSSFEAAPYNVATPEHDLRVGIRNVNIVCFIMLWATMSNPPSHPASGSHKGSNLGFGTPPKCRARKYPIGINTLGGFLFFFF